MEPSSHTKIELNTQNVAGIEISLEILSVTYSMVDATIFGIYSCY